MPQMLQDVEDNEAYVTSSRTMTGLLKKAVGHRLVNANRKKNG
jgi:hypothetical protein